MTATTKVPLGAATLNRKWYLDVNAGTPSVPDWVGVFGINDFKDNVDPTLQDDSDFDSEGYKSSTVTALAWSIEAKVTRKTPQGSPTAYDPGQEALRLAGAEMGEDNVVHVRWYEMTPDGPRAEAYEGRAAVSWTPDGGPMDANSTATVTLTGQGKRNPITHPDGATVAPTISALVPNSAATAGGDLIIIEGTGFTGATAVKVAAVAVASGAWEVISDTRIALIAPAKAAGAKAVTVENAAGASAGSNLTYA
ncbi:MULTISPECIES: phage tail tube protein [unclassified Nocardioides]|uniref:phage tail tube protein n=1 Tax=unclassified Nocardioides TaxID=2615069 RepID=UPI0009F09B21|nr:MULTISPECIES: IPT/TIG domain-containing protein [unclassified Nocardioides]GAW50615.1 uncharacterized protein PD653B2_2951 [Nocardioides sp. PD653-B2]GAW55514.1 uncharacterized protein PD653_2939 [Nocardioides sp. PD653]